MKPGRVVKIRLSPADCMACVDIVNKVGANRDGMSFAQCVILALSSSIQSFKANGLIPDRDGFEYTRLMAPFSDQPHIDRARKLQLSRILGAQKSPVPALVSAADPSTNRKRTRFEELAFKANNNHLNMTDEEKIELTTLTQELYPV